MARVKAFLLLVIVFCCLSSCKNKAVEFNNRLVNIQKSVLGKVNDFGIKMREIKADTVPDIKIKAQVEEVTAFIDNKIKKTKNLLVPKGGGDLKEAILKQLQFEKEVIENIGRLADPQLSEEEKTQIETGFLSSKEKAIELEANVRAAQEAFSRQNQFKLEKQ